MDDLQLGNVFLTLAVSLLLTFVTMPIVRIIARKIGAVDVPKDGRRMHTSPIPRLGGIAMVFGFIISVLLFADITKKPMQCILIGAIIIAILGLIDDIKPINAKIKVAVQIIAAGIAVYGGLTVNFLSVPRFISESGILVFSPVVSLIVSMIWILGITNAVNLIDGLDGLAAGISTIASLSMLVIAIMVNEPVVALITAGLAGCCIGFLPFNMNPAKIFMGDSGSTFLGFILATTSIQGLFKGYALISFAIPFLILGLPIFDTGFAIVRRIIKRQPIMMADRGHLHHRLIDMGFSQKQTVAILYSISSLLGLSAIIMANNGALRGVILIVAVILSVAVGAYFMTKPDYEESIKKGEEGQGDEKQ